MRIAFIDHPYHKKTKSSSFFIDIITSNNDIEFFYPDNDQKDCVLQLFSDINAGSFDCVIFWQIIPHYKLLSSLISSNVVFVPMYDACHNWKYFQWRKYRQFRFISFSKTLHAKLSTLGISSFYVCYMPPLLEDFDSKSVCKNDQSIFVWNRNGSIQIDKVFTFIHNNQWNRVVLHEAPDTHEADNKEKHINFYEFQVERTTWFKNQTEYLQAINTCDIYISPREYEGIGLSFLEAMSRGLCVVAKNNPTMNEYIKDGFNGILFDSYKELSVKKITNLIQIKKNAYITCNAIREEYNRTIPLLLQFIHPYHHENKAKVRYGIKFLVEDVSLLIYQCYRALLRRIKY